jgi:hypothetical protein
MSLIPKKHRPSLTSPRLPTSPSVPVDSAFLYTHLPLPAISQPTSGRGKATFQYFQKLADRDGAHMPVLVPRTRHHLVHLQPCTVKIRSKGVLQSRPQLFPSPGRSRFWHWLGRLQPDGTGPSTLGSHELAQTKLAVEIEIEKSPGCWRGQCFSLHRLACFCDASWIPSQQS